MKLAHSVERTDAIDASAPPAMAPVIAATSGTIFAIAIARAVARGAMRTGISDTIVTTVTVAQKLPMSS